MTKYAAKGTQLKIGDGGVGAGSQAFVEWGSGNAKIRIKWGEAGTAGNGKNITVVVSGSSYVYTTLTSSEISITVPTTATVAQVIANLEQQAVFDQYWAADFGATPGDGSGTITARTVTPTAGGTNGTEVFTLIPGIRNLEGPSLNAESIDVTTHDTAGDYREVIPTFLSGGEVTFNLIYDPANAVHENLFTAFENKTLTNFREVFPDVGGTDWQFAAYVTQMAPSAPIDDALTLAVTLSVTGAVDRTP